MAFAPDATDKSDQKEVEEAFRKWMNDKVTEACAKCISKLIECETHREKFYLFSKCGKQKKELADCCVQFAEKMRKTSAAAKQPAEK